MAKQPETIFKEKVLGLLKKLAPRIKHTKVQQVAKRGTPDIIICANGRYVEWELKTEAGKPDPLQLYEMEKTAKAHGLAWIVQPSNLEWSLLELQRIAGMEPRTINELEFQHGSTEGVLSSPVKHFQVTGSDLRIGKTRSPGRRKGTPRSR